MELKIYEPTQTKKDPIFLALEQSGTAIKVVIYENGKRRDCVVEFRDDGTMYRMPFLDSHWGFKLNGSKQIEEGK